MFPPLRKLAYYAVSNYSGHISIKFLRELTKLDYKTIESYLNYLSYAFLVYFLPSYSIGKIKEVLIRNKKVYVV